MTGTFGGALEARDIPAGEGYLYSEATGEVELDGKILVIRRIHVRYHLKIDPSKHDVAERVLGFHADYCPTARTIRDCVDITTSLEMENI
ncbi:MAG: OsmC family protein [Candidatus Promineifilaceae bacterium]